MPPNTKNLRVAVLSDLHFYKQQAKSTSAKKDSWLALEDDGLADKSNPWNDLESLIGANELNVDAILCPGDITNKSDPDGLIFAWSSLNSLIKKLNANILAVATGNHDVISHSINQDKVAQDILDSSPGKDGPLRELRPIYPIVFNESLEGITEKACRDRRTEYFGSHFTHFENDQYLLVVLNTCANHGENDHENKRGSISKSTLDELTFFLENRQKGEKKICILLCHHHPIQHANIDKGQYDFAFNGTRLTELLANDDDWIIIHGHKHHPRVVYASSQSNDGPVIFAAGSFSAFLNESISSSLRNQFYIIDIKQEGSQPPVGQIRSWNWFNGMGWSENLDPKTGVISGSGFGTRDHPNILAHEIANCIGSEPIAWEELCKKISKIKFLLPGMHDKLERALANFFEIEIEKENGIFRTIGRKN